ncbi:nitroreductase family protein [Bifidobacterium callimiconis]|uniref:Putative TM nitroreductase n=1 Tax=Bifidobacterium callimiconis TaxID=2306973 RepID=A0A430FBC3_9BIFI|nr:nitroreductase family protein [Bifidobacterium callimiconis]MBT1177013.1 nitroreductase [Bifidobacterium callimiconis]RSX50098.1 putative TM nitroreductase [Bifidobacterium callimiconis]
MDLIEAMEARHAIRMYTDEPVADDVIAALQSEIDTCNTESGLHIQMTTGLNDAFLGLKTHYGRFKGVHNTIALIGAADGTNSGWTKEGSEDAAATDPGEIALQQTVGYYGERLALKATQLGLATSWAVLDDAMSAENPWWTLAPGEKIVWVLAFGHGARPGGKHRSKPIEDLCTIPEGENMPDWFRAGMEAAMLAPTSLSQQPFHFTLHADGTVSARATEGLFAHVSLGCAIYHFEAASGHTVNWR